MSYAYRKDNRTDEEFNEQIYCRTLRERILIHAYADLFRRTTKKEITIIDNGADNTGKVIKGSVAKDSDFLVKTNNRSGMVEVKVSPSPRITTFKVKDLNYFEKQKNNYVFLVFYNTLMYKTSLIPDRETKYFFITKRDIAWIKQFGKYDKANHLFGGHPTYMLEINQIVKKFKTFELYENDEVYQEFISQINTRFNL